MPSDASRIETIYAMHPLRAETILARVGLMKTLPGLVSEADLAIDTATDVTDQNHPGGASNVRKLAREAGVCPGCLIIDVGCGLGGPARLLAEEYGAVVDGVELTATRYRDAVRLTQLAGLEGKVHIRHGNFLTLDLPARHYDVVWGQASWVHFSDLRAVLARAAVVLGSGGCVAVEEAYLRRQPQTPDMAQRLSELEECWAAHLNDMGVWVGAVEGEGFTLTGFTDLTAMMSGSLLRLQECVAQGHVETLNTNELRSWDLAAELIQAGVLGYMRLVARLTTSSGGTNP